MAAGRKSADHHPHGRKGVLDVLAIAVTAAIWGTTWFAITLQLGAVDPIASLVYRFGLASALLFAWCALRGERLGLTPAQHRAAAGLGLFTFAIDYAFTYWAEALVVSAVVAVLFASLAFINLVMFRLIFGLREPRSAWVATALGASGVGLISWGELVQARLDGQALVGLSLAFAAVLAGSFGNVFARYAEAAAAPLGVSTAWSMAYGAVLLALFALATGRPWTFDARAPYVLSLLYLAVMGSVVAFLLYFTVARSRGYGTAGYILALTPLLAMAISSRFEGKTWSIMGIGGATLVLFGQWLLLRTRSRGGMAE
jgi:drug/metabolite transporter (DMT)-like permease